MTGETRPERCLARGWALPLVGIVLFSLLLPDSGIAKPKVKMSRQELRENLVARFGDETHKRTMLRRELDGIADVLTDLRDLELYPSSLTGLEGRRLIVFDKKIDRIENQRRALLGRLGSLRSPILDTNGLNAMRRMIANGKVDQLFEVLEVAQQDDTARVNQMLEFKSAIDTLWKSTETLLLSAMADMNIRPEKRSLKKGFERDFFDILQANLLIHYQNINALKDSLANRATVAEAGEMFAIEKGRLNRYFKDDRIPLVVRKIREIKARYAGRVDLTDVLLLDARIAILQGDMERVLASIHSLPVEGEKGMTVLLYRLQGQYATGQYDSVWAKRDRIDFRMLKGDARNLLIWIVMESGLALGKADVPLCAHLASWVEKKYSYARHVMHALGRAHLAQGDPAGALAVFENAQRFVARAEVDRYAAHELRTAIAATNYELGHYRKSLDLFYDMLSNPSDFALAVHGMMWCYVGLGLYDAAETTIAKLLDKAPWSRYVPGAILTREKIHLVRARGEWRNVLHQTREEERLREMIATLDERQRRGQVADSAAVRIRAELRQLLAQLLSEKRNSYDTVIGYYDRIETAGERIASGRAEGMLAAKSVTERHEQMLSFIDSCVMVLKGVQTQTFKSVVLTRRRPDSVFVGASLAEAKTFRMEALLDRSRFEQEYLVWQKSRVNYYLQETIRKKSDPVSRQAAKKREARFSRILDSLVVAEEHLQARWHGRLSAILPAFIATLSDTAEAAYFQYLLAELHYADENARYSREYERFERIRERIDRRMKALAGLPPSAEALLERIDLLHERGCFRRHQATSRDKGHHLFAWRWNENAPPPLVDLPAEPVQPWIDHSESMAAFERVLAMTDSGETAAAAHYGLAWCWNDVAVFDSALAHMTIVGERYPASSFASQAWMYLGEYRFDKGDLPGAIECYQAVIGYPGSKWFDKALYKMAWTQYRLSNTEKSISSFLALVDLTDGMRKGGSILEHESMDYIAISFSEADLVGAKGLERAVAFVKKFDDPGRGSQIIRRLAQVYREQERYEMAKRAYHTFDSLYPTHPDLPIVENELLNMLMLETTPETAHRQKVEFFKKFSRGNLWSDKQVDSAVVALGDSLAEDNLYEAAVGFHELAFKRNDTAIYNIVLGLYSLFVESYPMALRAGECMYNRAEIEFSLGNYSRAAKDYLAASQWTKDNAVRETAAWNAIVCSQSLLKEEWLNAPELYRKNNPHSSAADGLPQERVR